jgi:hypothetical protein
MPIIHRNIFEEIEAELNDSVNIDYTEDQKVNDLIIYDD